MPCKRLKTIECCAKLYIFTCMTIVLAADQFDSLNNGTTVSAYRFAQNLRSRGHTVRVLTTGKPGEDKYILPLLHIPIVSPIAKTQGIIFSKAVPEVIRDALKGADIIHFYLPFPMARVAETIAREMGVPCIAGFHVQAENITYNIGLGKSERASRFFYRFLYKYFFNRFADIHCPSRFIAGELEKNGYTAKLHVISNGVDPAFTPQPGVPHDTYNILMTGRLSPEKRQDLIIKAARLSKYRGRIKLFFAGRGPLHKKYLRMCGGLPHAPVFGFYSTDELKGLFRKIDLYVHASDIEIEAIACIEAFSCGLVPVIADAPKSATTAFALDGRSLFKAGDARDLAKKIDYWIEHPEEKEKMGEKYVALGKKYSISSSIDQMEKLYETIINEHKARQERNI